MAAYEPVHQFLQTQLQDRDITLVVTAQILHEFVHVVTDARRFDPPVTMVSALNVARVYLGNSNVECVVTDLGCLQTAFVLIEQYQLGRNRIADTLFAATLIRHEVKEVITCNPRDFRIFEDLMIIDPREAAP